MSKVDFVFLPRRCFTTSLFLFYLVFSLLPPAVSAGTKLQWVRATLPVGHACPQTCFEQADKEFAKRLVQLTTVQVEPKLKWLELTDLAQLVKYPFLFFHVDWEVDLPEPSVKNIREYIARGGFIFAEDCLDCSARGNAQYQGLRRVWESKIFPGKSLVRLPKTHPIFQQPYDLTKTVPKLMSDVGGMGFYDEKGRLVLFISSFGVNCHWNVHQDVEDLYRLRTNVMTYVLTH